MQLETFEDAIQAIDNAKDDTTRLSLLTPIRDMLQKRVDKQKERTGDKEETPLSKVKLSLESRNDQRPFWMKTDPKASNEPGKK